MTELGNNRIQKFTADGQFITRWGTEGTGDGQLSGPTGITLDSAGNVYVTELGNNRVQVFGLTSNQSNIRSPNTTLTFTEDSNKTDTSSGKGNSVPPVLSPSTNRIANITSDQISDLAAKNSNTTKLENNRLSVFKQMASKNISSISNQTQGDLSENARQNTTFVTPTPIINFNTSSSSARSNELLANANKSPATTNSPPYANAGPDLVVDKNTNVTLKGNLSSDKDSERGLVYQWSQTSGPPLAMNNTQTANPSFIVPATTKNNTLFEFLLSVTDNENASDSDTSKVTVITTNKIPVANAGIDQVVSNMVPIILLNGTESDDPDGDQLAYSWNQTSGLDISLLNNNSPYPTLLTSSIPKSNSSVSLAFTLTVNDGQFSSKPDNVTITIGEHTSVRPAAVNETTSVRPAAVNETTSVRPAAVNETTSVRPAAVNETTSVPTPAAVNETTSVPIQQLSMKPHQFLLQQLSMKPHQFLLQQLSMKPHQFLLQQLSMKQHQFLQQAVNETTSVQSSSATGPPVRHLPKSLQIEITSPTEGDKVSMDNLQITGRSTDDDQTDCQVYVHTDKDILPRKASGKDPSNEDYSTWSAVYNNSQIDASAADMLSIIAELTCINTPVNLTASYAVNVVGSESLEQEAPQESVRSLHDR